MSRIPLTTTYRGGNVDGVHQGSIAVADRSGKLLYTVNDPTLPAYLRSSSKMFQAIPVIRSGAADRFGLTPQELAVCCASHSAAQYHLDAVRSILGKIGLDEPDLRCGAHDPHDRAELERMICAHEAPTQLHNNCSGKHAGMLATCLAKGWPLDSYLELRHPLQQWNLSLISEFSGVPANEIRIGIDGCSLPTFYIPIAAMSTALARFVGTARDGDDATSRLLSSVGAYPEMIYERGGFDSELIRILGGRCIAKRGAMAIYVVGIDSPQHGPIGITAKLEDGNITPMPPIIIRVLDQLGLLSTEESEQLAQYRKVTQTNWRGVEVGEIAATFDLIPSTVDA